MYVSVKDNVESSAGHGAHSFIVWPEQQGLLQGVTAGVSKDTRTNCETERGIGGASSGVDMVLVVLMAVVGRGVGLVAVRTKGGERRGDDDNTGHGLSRKG
ncbi:hypothetical protein BC827DRAFT_1155306 [Russula dissimulans]|nr:hypothetical protein BC827DRAFT_1155306 [Russula dissimulans]